MINLKRWHVLLAGLVLNVVICMCGISDVWWCCKNWHFHCSHIATESEHVLHDCADFFEKQHVIISFIDIHVCWNDFLFLCQLPLHRNPEVQDDSTVLQMQAWWLHGNMIDVAVNWPFLYPSDGLHVMSRDCQFHVAYIQPCAMASLQLVKTKHVSESCVGSAWPCSHSSAAGWARSWTFFMHMWVQGAYPRAGNLAWNIASSQTHETCSIDLTVMNHDVWTRNTHLLYSFIDLI